MVSVTSTSSKKKRALKLAKKFKNAIKTQLKSNSLIIM